MLITVRRTETRFSKLVLVLGVIIGFSVTAFPQQTLRPLTTDDLFKLEEIGQVAISPDGIFREDREFLNAK